MNYTVYMITNMINNKKYIGSTINLKQRWRTHRTASNQLNNPKYQLHLYYSMNHYGIENFNFSILKDDFSSLEEMWQYEHDKIIEFDTTNPDKGYNNTDKTGPDLARENYQEHCKKIKQPCAKVDIDENVLEIYESYHDAAERNGYDRNAHASQIRKVCKGIRTSCFDGLYFRDLDDNGNIVSIPEQIEKAKNKLITSQINKNKVVTNNRPIYGINLETGEEYFFTSVIDAAREIANNKNVRSSIHSCLAGRQRHSIVHGWTFRRLDEKYNIIEPNPDLTLEDVIKRYDQKNPEINGERKTVIEWCALYNINPTTYRYRVNKMGWNPEKALKTPVKGAKRKEDDS